MAIPQQLVNATPSFISWCDASVAKMTEIKNTRGRYFQGEHGKQGSEYTKIVEVPGTDDFGRPYMRRERQAAESFDDFLAGRPVHSFLPGTLDQLRINRYEGPQGEGWFITALVGIGGKQYLMSYDGAGPEDRGFSWREFTEGLE